MSSRRVHPGKCAEGAHKLQRHATKATHHRPADFRAPAPTVTSTAPLAYYYTPGDVVVDAHRTRGLDFYGQILLCPPKYAHGWPLQSAWLGFTNVRGTPGVGLPAPHPVVASWTHTVRMVCTSKARYVYGHRSMRTNGACKRRGWDGQTLGGPPPLACTHHTRWSRLGRTPYVWSGIPRPDTSMAAQVRARMSRASGVVGMRK